MNKTPKPPPLAKRLLTWFLRDDLDEEVNGDLDQRYYRVLEKKSLLRARLRYWFEVFHYMRPFAIRKSTLTQSNPLIMHRHILLLAYRNFKRYKSSFFINLVGLSTGLACTLLIYLWVNDELSVDTFNEKDSRLFRAMEHRVRATGIWTSPSSPGPMADALAEDIPEIEMTVATTWPQHYTLTVNDKNVNAGGRYAGKNFFKMLSYKLLQGDENQVLIDKSSIVISDVMARKLFNTTDNVIGRTVEFEHETPFQVSGVFTAMPDNATEQFEFVMPFAKYREGRDWLDSWGNTSLITFVLLKPGVNADSLNTKLAHYIHRKTKNEITYRTLFLKGFSANYLHGNYVNGVLTGGRITYVKLFSIIAVVILLIACINFMNLSTARASRRIKEVGVKKAIGVGRGSLAIQYLGESMLLTLISLSVGVILVVLLLPQFNEITGKHLTLMFNSKQVLGLLAVTLFTGLIAGSYPALYLSGFQAAAVLKGKLTGPIGEVWARKGLVVFQFALSIIFIVSVMVVYKQIEFVQSTNLGYDKDNLLYFGLSGELSKVKNQEVLIEEIRNIPGVVNASTIGHDMTGHNGGTWGVEWPGKNPDDKTEFERVFVNYGMIETLGVEMAEGRSFSRSYGSDTSAIIFNQKAVEFMGMKDPIGKVVKLWGHDVQIIGVVKDFHYESLHENFKPVFFKVIPEETYLLMVRLTPGKEQEIIPQLQALYSKLNPGFAFDYQFLDVSYKLQYASEQRVATLSKYFAGLAILISCLGLFGLAAFTAERRLKEIGIRKVMGSSVSGIVYLLSSDFTKTVLVAIVVAIPLSYLVARTWLDTFAFKIPLQLWFFIAAGLLALAIAWLTVGFQAIRAARVNPAKCLKNES